MVLLSLTRKFQTFSHCAAVVTADWRRSSAARNFLVSGNDGSVVGKLVALSVGIYAGGWQIDCVGREQKWPQDRSLGDPR